MSTDNTKENELIEAFRKYQEEVQKNLPQTQGLYRPYHPSCPNCGYCPHCGRGGYFQPYITW